MLNRHAIVLFLGCAALVLLRDAPVALAGIGPIRLPYSWMGLSFLSVVVGLFLDNGLTTPRTAIGRALQATGAIVLLVDSLRMFSVPGALHLALAEAGIALTVLGVYREMTSKLESLKSGVVLQVVGDVLYMASIAVAFVLRERTPNLLGWIFIGISGLLGLYAAITNLALQMARLRNPQAGWRFKVLSFNGQGLQIKTPKGECRIPWRLVEAVTALDDRRLIFVLPRDLPQEISATELPMDELRTNAEPQFQEGAPPPDRYGLVFHEQELGCSVDVAQSLAKRQLLVA